MEHKIASHDHHVPDGHKKHMDHNTPEHHKAYAHVGMHHAKHHEHSKTHGGHGGSHKK